MRPIARPLAAMLVGIVLLGSAGCGKAADKLAEKAAEKAIESQGGDGANVDIGKDGKFEIQTKDGSYSAATGKIPKDWPKDVPLPKGLEVVTGSAMGSATEKLMSVSATTKMSPDEVTAFYDNALKGWEEANRYNSTSDGSSYGSVTYNSGERNVQLTTTTDAKGATTISITYTSKTDG